MFQKQVNRWLDGKINNVLDMLNQLIGSFNASNIFTDEQKADLKNFSESEIEPMRIPQPDTVPDRLPSPRNPVAQSQGRIPTPTLMEMDSENEPEEPIPSTSSLTGAELTYEIIRYVSSDDDTFDL